KRIERRIDETQERRIAQRYRPASDRRLSFYSGDDRLARFKRWKTKRREASVVGALMVEMLIPTEALEQLDAVHAPPGQIVSQQFDRAESALAAPERDRVRDIRAQ